MTTTQKQNILEQMTVKKRAVLYARTSSDDTTTDSLTGQLNVCEKFANDNSYIIVAQLQEDVRGVKGDDRHAPALNKALEMAQAGLYDVLVIRDVKRYSRDVYKAMDFERQFFDSGIEIEYVWNQELNGLPRKGTSAIMRFIQYWMSEQDREEIVKKLYLARLDKVKRKGSTMTNGKPPYGYTEQVITEGSKKRRILVINPDEEKWVKQIFHWYVVDRMSLRTIETKLKELCVPKPSVSRQYQDTGKYGPFEWRAKTIAAILARRAYIGEWEYSKNISRKRTNAKKSIIADDISKTSVIVKVPPIVDKELYEAAQVTLSQNKAYTHKKSEYEFLFRGRCRCRLCGYAGGCLVRTSPRKAAWKKYKYVCTRRRATRPHPITGEVCKMPYLDREIIEADTWQWLKKLVNDDEELKKGYQAYLDDKETKIEPLLEELARIEKGIAECNDKLAQQTQALTLLQNIGSTHAVEVITREILTIEEMINRYNAEKEKIKAEITEEAVNIDFINNFDEFITIIREEIELAENDFNLKRKIIEALDVTVEFTVENGQAVFYPKCILRTENTPILYPFSEMALQDKRAFIVLQARIVYRGKCSV